MKNETYQNWTLEEEKQLEELVVQGNLSYQKIGDIMNRPYNSILNKSKRLKLKSLYIPRTYSYNINFWKNYTPLNCYYAGFISADGNITKYSTRIEIHKQDIEILNNFKKDAEIDNPLYFYTEERRKNLVRLSINTISWVQDLNNNFGIMQKKSARISIPNINLYLKFCWMLGYTDGDGCLTLRKYKNDKNAYLHFYWTSCSYKCIKQIFDILNEYFPSLRRNNRLRKIRKLSYCKAYNINLYGDAALAFYLFLKEFPIPKLSRKWENPKIISFVENFKLTNKEDYLYILNHIEKIKEKMFP